MKSVTILRKFINGLAFTRPKAGREVGPLNWTQEHKCVWDGPALKATGHAAGPRAIGPCRCRTTSHRLGELANSNCRPLRMPACVAHGHFLKVRNFAPFSEFLVFYTLRVEIFRMFLSFHVYVWTLWTTKSFMEIGLHVFEKSGRQRHRHMRQHYIIDVVTDRKLDLEDVYLVATSSIPDHSTVMEWP